MTQQYRGTLTMTFWYLLALLHTSHSIDQQRHRWMCTTAEEDPLMADDYHLFLNRVFLEDASQQF